MLYDMSCSQNCPKSLYFGHKTLYNSFKFFGRKTFETSKLEDLQLIIQLKFTILTSFYRSFEDLYFSAILLNFLSTFLQCGLPNIIVCLGQIRAPVSHPTTTECQLPYAPICWNTHTHKSFHCIEWERMGLPFL